MNESIDSELSDLLNISINFSPSPLSIVDRDLLPIEGLAGRDELRFAGRNGGHLRFSRAGGVGGRSESRRSQGMMWGDIIRARSQDGKYHPIAATHRLTVSSDGELHHLATAATNRRMS